MSGQNSYQGLNASDTQLLKEIREYNRQYLDRCKYE